MEEMKFSLVGKKESGWIDRKSVLRWMEISNKTELE